MFTPLYRFMSRTSFGSLLRSSFNGEAAKKALAEDKTSDADVLFELRDGDGRKVTFSAHRDVLAAESEVFRAMFYGPLIGDSRFKEILLVRIEDSESDVFKEMLKFVYHKRVDLTENNALHLLFAANKYMLKELSEVCVEFLESKLSPDNFGILFEAAQTLNDKETEEKLLVYYRLNAVKILRSPTFLELSRSSLSRLVETNCVNAKELDVYKACLNWARFHTSRWELERDIETSLTKDSHCDAKIRSMPSLRSMLGEKVLHGIRFPTMTRTEFDAATKMAPVLTAKETRAIKYAISTRIKKHNLEYPARARGEFLESQAYRDVETAAEVALMDDHLNETMAIPLVTAFVSAVKVLGRRGFNRVQIDLELVEEGNSARLASATGWINSDRIDFLHPVKMVKDKIYKVSARYDHVTRAVDGSSSETSIAVRKGQKRKLEEVLYLIHRETSAILKVFYYAL